MSWMLLFMIITAYFQKFVYLSKQIQSVLKCALPKMSSCDEMDNF